MTNDKKSSPYFLTFLLFFLSALFGWIVTDEWHERKSDAIVNQRIEQLEHDLLSIEVMIMQKRRSDLLKEIGEVKP